MLARIYRPAKTAMQSGRGKSLSWRLEFEPAAARTIDPLMGWTSSGDMKQQIRLRFETKEEAIAYAERNGVPYRVEEPGPNLAPRRKASYADNFKTTRIGLWTH